MRKKSLYRQIQTMSIEEMANFFHYKLGSSSCPDCIINNLKDESYCENLNGTCLENIKKFLSE